MCCLLDLGEDLHSTTSQGSGFTRFVNARNLVLIGVPESKDVQSPTYVDSKNSVSFAIFPTCEIN